MFEVSVLNRFTADFLVRYFQVKKEITDKLFIYKPCYLYGILRNPIYFETLYTNPIKIYFKITFEFETNKEFIFETIPWFITNRSQHKSSLAEFDIHSSSELNRHLSANNGSVSSFVSQLRNSFMLRNLQKYLSDSKILIRYDLI